MKVCFVTTSFPAYQGDIQSPFIYQLAKHLAQRKVDLTVICPNYKKSKAKNEVMEGIKVKHPDAAIEYAANLDDAEKRLREILREGDVALVMGAGDIDSVARKLVT